ncbi:MAG TPA: DUF6537 domain-containing protein [Phycisphaerae bacterium]|nr:DUF6537 domain-containing protein [Phycisphaerae bacterium]
MRIDERFLRGEGREIFNGNELLVKGALETEGGVHLLTGYPGSPVASFFDVLQSIGPLLREKGIEGTISNNEAVAVAAVNGSQMAPLRAMAVLKSVGGHVASDGLALGNLAGANAGGGAVVAFGDDPWSDSTQVPADSRFLCQHLRMPVLEPSDPQELKDWVDLGFKLSQASTLYVGYMVTTTLADGGGAVLCRPNHYPLTNRHHPIEIVTSELDTEKTVLLPPRTGRREEELHLRFARLQEAARKLSVNRVENADGKARLGIITSGMAYQYVIQALADLGVSGRFPILKMGITWPVDAEAVVRFVHGLEHVVVIEERRAFLEQQVLQAIAANTQAGAPRVWGKRFPDSLPSIPAVRGLNPSIVTDRLGRLLHGLRMDDDAATRRRIDRQLALIADTADVKVDIPLRTPTFCPGCPHRDSSSALLEIKRQFTDGRYMRKHHGCGAVDLVFHGDTGCYTMMMFRPNSDLMHNYSGMGLGGATGSGVDPFVTNKQVVFMGDSTFFHSGQIAISNSIKQNQDITYIILDNGSTAMTGHQPTPGVDRDLLGRVTLAQDIERVVHAMTGDGRRTVIRTDPSNRRRYRKLLERVILADGVKVLIADKECGITYNRRVVAAERAEEQRRGFLRKKTYMNITPEVCEFCLACTRATGCPGLVIEDTDVGAKMATDLSWCVNDQACAKIRACPSFEEIIVTRRRAPVPPGEQMRLDDLPESQSRLDEPIWRAWLAGVGGMGIGVAAAILVRAGHHQGYRVLFADKKGLAIRSGGVYSQVIFARDDAWACQVIPFGRADLLLGLDLLEAARAVDPRVPFRVASPQHTAAVINADKTPTITTLIQEEDFDVGELDALLRRRTRADAYFTHRLSYQCERLFGTKLYANVAMLGVAYQKGLIPVSLDSMKAGILETVRQTDFKKNMRAFNLGRKLVTSPELFAVEKPSPSLARTVREKAMYLTVRRVGRRRALRPERPGPAARLKLPDTKRARQYKHLAYTTLRACRELDRVTMRQIALRIYDLVQWGGYRYALDYATRLRRVFLADDAAMEFEATRAVAANLAKLMLVKDEFYVAHLLTSIEKLRRDRQRYRVNPANGDRMRYRRTFHPRVLGKPVSIRVPHWALYVLRELRLLRRVMPLYHRADKKYLDWYREILDRFAYTNEAEYRRFVEALRGPEQFSGYREYRYPDMETARQRSEQLLATITRPPAVRSKAGA